MNLPSPRIIIFIFGLNIMLALIVGSIGTSEVTEDFSAPDAIDIDFNDLFNEDFFSFGGLSDFLAFILDLFMYVGAWGVFLFQVLTLSIPGIPIYVQLPLVVLNGYVLITVALALIEWVRNMIPLV